MDRHPYAPSAVSRQDQSVNGDKRPVTRRGGQNKAHAMLGIGNTGTLPPAAPDIPNGPPTSLRNPNRSVTQPQTKGEHLSRSFSARARGLPFDQDIRDSEKRYNEWAESQIATQPDQRPRSYRPIRTDSVHRNDASGPSTRISSATYQSSQRRASDTPQAQRQPVPASQPARSSTLREHRDPITPTSPTSGGEYSHRSPLQKLEGTLNNISKEEKRARVQEAEFLLQESKKAGGRISRDQRDALPVQTPTLAPERQTSRRAAPSTRTDDSKVARSSSTRQRESLPPLNTTGVSETRELALEPRTSEYRRQRSVRQQAGTYDDAVPSQTVHAREAPRETVGAEGTRLRPASYQPRPIPQDRPPQTAQIPRHHADSFKAPQRSATFSSRDADPQIPRIQRRADTLPPSNETTARRSSLPVPGPGGNAAQQVVPPKQVKIQPFAENRKSGPLHEANSSHKAALAEAAMIGAGNAAVMSRSNSRKLQKAPPKEYSPTVNTPRRRWSPEEPAQNLQPASEPKTSLEEEKYFQENPPRQAGLNVRKTRQPVNSSSEVQHEEQAETSREDDQHYRRLSGMFHQKPRQNSVSFREPSSTIRKLDEWRSGGVLRLSDADCDLRTSLTGPGVSKDKAWWEGGGTARRYSGTKAAERSRALDALEGRTGRNDEPVKSFNPPLYLLCGPLLRYTGMKREKIAKANPRIPTERETWRGSVMIVTDDSQSSYEVVPTLRLFAQPMDLIPLPPAHIDYEIGEKLAPEHVDPIAGLTKMSRTGKTLFVKPVEHLEEQMDVSMMETDDGLFEESPSFIETDDGQVSSNSKNRLKSPDGETLGKYKEIKGVRLYADAPRNVTFWRFSLEVELGDHQKRIAYSINRGPAVGFWVPARGQSMNVMFHTCNGFSLSVDPDNFSGPDPLWRDVLNSHQTRPFHVMIGGGDQIYNDAVSQETTIFQEWLAIKNPHEKHNFPFSPALKNELEAFYLERYSMWFSQGLFGMANAQIPMINIWDDHDIIDGYGSYPDHFMNTPVFKGLGAVAFKYYMLFQHQSVPEETHADEPSWLLGASPGPYINELSRNLFMYLGKGLAFLGLDCRTERKRDQVLTDETYDIILDRCRRELVEGDVKHLIVLIGVPIAYPRLVWLENVLTSRAMDPIKAIGKMGVLGNFLNKFDNGVEILDDLDDHWTAKNHKEERNLLVQDLQELAAEKSVRITILGGDVHLAAIGQFYSNPKLKVPKDRDHRYIPNVISSAIVNTPPPEMMADVLNKRNKVHHLDDDTDEDMIPMFTHDVDGSKRNNKRLLPRRNWCSIREYHPGSTPPPTPPPQDPPTPDANQFSSGKLTRSLSWGRGDSKPGNLLRRLSGRGKPPSSWKGDSFPNTNNSRPGSAGAPPTSHSQDSYFPASAPTRGTNGSTSQSPNGDGATAPFRPRTFLRRPTNLSERAAKKGGPDLESAEIHDHINLEGGLDIILNCEVNPSDPAGITVPYRLLVPALDYDGTADLNHEAEYARERENRPKPRWLSRFGRLGRGSSNAADNQGQGNWGGYDSDDNDDDNSLGDERRTGGGLGYSGVEAYKEKRRWF